MKYLFVTSMFRSGSTLLGRVLDSHPSIHLESDYLFHFFRFLRNSVGKQLFGESFDCAQPLWSSKNPEQKRIMDHLSGKGLDVPVSKEESEQLIAACVAIGGDFIGEAVAPLKAIEWQDSTYREVLRRILDTMHSVYGGGETYQGVKVVWCDQFLDLLAQEFPDAKFVHIVRNPLAVYCSARFGKFGSYPADFVADHWGDSIAFSQQMLNSENDSMIQIRYEDLVENREAVMEKVWEFLKLEPAPDYRPSFNGEVWKGNSSYGKSFSSVSNGVSREWARRLSLGTVGYMEEVTRQGREQLGYDDVIAPGSIGEGYGQLIQEEKEGVCSWLLPYFSYCEETQRFEYLPEYIG